MEFRIQGLTKTYPNGVRALRDVSLTIPPGMFGLLGPNGAGKSTLMRTLATLQEPDSGTARLGDIDIVAAPERLRAMLGYLPQDFGLDPTLTAEELLTHLAALKGVDGRKGRAEAVRALLQRTNLYPVRRRKLGTFSGGMRQRFGIAQALLGNPRLIIVDEPTAGLDPEERSRFLDLISEISESVVVILSTHIVEDVSGLCQQMAVLADGQILWQGAPEAAVQALAGRLWAKRVPRKDVATHQGSLQVLSTSLQGGQVLLHVLAEEAPDSTFQPAAPSLEDAYFAALRRRGA